MSPLPNTAEPAEIRAQLHRDGHVVVESVIQRDTALELRRRVEVILERERAHPTDPGDVPVGVDQAAEVDFSLWHTREEEAELLRRRIRARQAEDEP